MNRSVLEHELSSLIDTLDYIDSFSEKHNIDDEIKAFNSPLDSVPDFKTRLSYSTLTSNQILLLFIKGKAKNKKAGGIQCCMVAWWLGGMVVWWHGGVVEWWCGAGRDFNGHPGI